MFIMAEKKRKKTSLGWFFWLAFILLVALLFFVNKNNIKTVLEKTNAKSLFVKEEKKDKQKEVDISVIQKEIEKINSDSSQEKTNANEKATNKNKSGKTEKEKKKSQAKIKDKKNGDKKIPENTRKEKETNTKSINKKKATAPKKQLETKEMTAKIYLVKIGSDGQIARKVLDRKLIKTDSPMSTVLESLLQGASLEESKKGYRSFIPPNTRLLSAIVKDGIAVINLSEEFQFNRYGIEAYQEQLAQIVFTACEFPTVNSVQFLIEGEKKNYLGGEGVWIGAPLSPDSF